MRGDGWRPDPVHGTRYGYVVFAGTAFPLVVIVAVLSAFGLPPLPLAMVGWLLCVLPSGAALAWWARRRGLLPASEPTRGTRRRPRAGEPTIPKPAIWFMILAYIGFIAATVLALPPAVAARTFTHPVRTTALAARGNDPCARCSTVAWALFAAEGRLVCARLWEPVQDSGYYRPGITIVYQAGDPAKAMALRDYTDGLGPVPPWSMGGTLTVLIVAVVVISRLRAAVEPSGSG